jgi:hypothetical protein
MKQHYLFKLKINFKENQKNGSFLCRKFEEILFSDSKSSFRCINILTGVIRYFLFMENRYTC